MRVAGEVGSPVEEPLWSLPELAWGIWCLWLADDHDHVASTARCCSCMACVCIMFGTFVITQLASKARNVIRTLDATVSVREGWSAVCVACVGSGEEDGRPCRFGARRC